MSTNHQGHAPPKGTMDREIVLLLRGLTVRFQTTDGIITAVDDVSFEIPRGKTIALVGESGCGKSVTALSILRLIPQPPGRIEHGEIVLVGPSPGGIARLASNGAASKSAGDARQDMAMPPGDTTMAGEQGGPTNLLGLPEKDMRAIRGNRIAMIFQEPMTALNPVLSVGEQIVEAIKLHQPLHGKAARAVAVDLMHKVGIPDPHRRFDQYPHQMSGGMLQRVMIAMALSCRPALLIADEPTTALDVTVQMEILRLLRRLQADTQMSILLITHDLAVVAEMAEYVYVMYAGRIVEHGPVGQVLAGPMHPYTQGLLRCLPRMEASPRRMEAIPGQVPDPSHRPSGCPFHPRCELSRDRALQPGRITVPVEGDVAAPSSRGSAQEALPKRSRSREVLRRCVEAFEGEPSGRPALREIRPGQYAACWEAERL